jgi:hypothetical protein
VCNAISSKETLNTSLLNSSNSVNHSTIEFSSIALVNNNTLLAAPNLSINRHSYSRETKEFNLALIFLYNYKAFLTFLFYKSILEAV